MHFNFPGTSQVVL